MSLLDELLDEAVDSEGFPIPLESVEARFIIQNYSHILDAEETVGELTFNAKKKGWSDEARKKAAANRKRKAVVKKDKPSSEKKKTGGKTQLKETEAKIKELKAKLDKIPHPRVGMDRGFARFLKQEVKDPTPAQIKQGIELSKQLSTLHAKAGRLQFNWTLVLPDNERYKIRYVQLKMRDNEAQADTYRRIASDFKKVTQILQDKKDLAKMVKERDRRNRGLTGNKGKIKGWTDEARKAAALKRKRKAIVAADRVSKASSIASKGTAPKYGELVPIKKNKAGEHVQANGKPLPKHVPKLPPAWTNVHVNVNPNATLWAKGSDEKGRIQSVYNPTFTAKNAAKKFAKVNELRKKKEAITNELQKDMKKPATREVSIVLALINHTGIRPGSDTNTKAAKQAYGATTLRAEHVKDGGTRLKFTGKKGVALDIKVTDPQLIKALADKAKGKAKGEKLFDVVANKLREYTQSKDGGGFNPKDFRTAKGTETAIAAMAGMKAPRNEAEYKKLVKKIAQTVSEQLGNTPTIALQSYIDPSVFASWRIK